MINRGRHARLIGASVGFSAVGLVVLAAAGASVPVLLIGILLVGIGYVLVLQTTTAWSKNLYPEQSRGQFEGVRIVFFVLIPMVLGPSSANVVIARWGVPVTIDGVSGMAPSTALFWLAAAIMVLTLIPTAMAVRTRKIQK